MTHNNRGGTRPKASRREFVRLASLAAAGLAVGAHRVWGAIPARATPAGLLPDVLEPGQLERLALAAIDAARQAGATYADVRVGDFQACRVICKGDLDFDVNVAASVTYGVRSYVGGSWGFVHGTVPTVDALATVARRAVAEARNAASAGTSSSAAVPKELVPAPVATGRWSTPCAIDPFAVPLHEQMAHLNEWYEIPVGGPVSPGRPGFFWQRETRVFASTDGALTTQTFHRSFPGQSVGGFHRRDKWDFALPVRGLLPTNGGYETVIRPTHVDDIRATVELVRPYLELPTRAVSVGRYPVMFDGWSFGSVLYRTVGQALELDRVLGDEADGSGTSYLTLDGSVGPVTFPSILSVRSDRALPSVLAVRWDDEGVESATHPLIEHGRVVDFESSRSTAAALRGWSGRSGTGQAVASSGSAVALEAGQSIDVRCGHLTVTPGTATFDDLVREMGHGLLVRVSGNVYTDHAMASGFMNDGQMFEVAGGRIVAHVPDYSVAMQWQTAPFWKGLVAIGGPGTVQEQLGSAYKGVPSQQWPYHATAPAALFKAVDVIELGGAP